jgi:hypothetical protein
MYLVLCELQHLSIRGVVVVQVSLQNQPLGRIVVLIGVGAAVAKPTANGALIMLTMSGCNVPQSRYLKMSMSWPLAPSDHDEIWG